MFRLATKRLALRHFTLQDQEPLMEIFGNPEVMRFGDGVQSAEWVRAWLQNCITRLYPRHGYGPYAVVQRQSHRLIGYCGLFFFADVGGQPEIEIGYRLARTAWGKGYASEAARAVRDFAFTRQGIRRLIAMIDPANTASIRVAEKIGMTYEKEVMFPGYSHPDQVYVVHSSGVSSKLED
jgi:ribosomal-protein-alanine N-acetyltransferase